MLLFNHSTGNLYYGSRYDNSHSSQDLPANLLVGWTQPFDRIHFTVRNILTARAYHEFDRPDASVFGVDSHLTVPKNDNQVSGCPTSRQAAVSPRGRDAPSRERGEDGASCI